MAAEEAARREAEEAARREEARAARRGGEACRGGARAAAARRDELKKILKSMEALTAQRRAQDRRKEADVRRPEPLVAARAADGPAGRAVGVHRGGGDDEGRIGGGGAPSSTARRALETAESSEKGKHRELSEVIDLSAAAHQDAREREGQLRWWAARWGATFGAPPPALFGDRPLQALGANELLDGLSKIARLGPPDGGAAEAAAESGGGGCRWPNESARSLDHCGPPWFDRRPPVVASAQLAARRGPRRRRRRQGQRRERRGDRAGAAEARICRQVQR